MENLKIYILTRSIIRPNGRTSKILYAKYSIKEALKLQKQVNLIKSKRMPSVGNIRLVIRRLSLELLIEELERHLNTFLAGKTLQLVLGIKIPQSRFYDKDLYEVPQLKLLSKSIFFQSQLENTGYKVFVVEERTIDIKAINPEDIKNEDLERLLALTDLFDQKKRDKFELFPKWTRNHKILIKQRISIF